MEPVPTPKDPCILEYNVTVFPEGGVIYCPKRNTRDPRPYPARSPQHHPAHIVTPVVAAGAAAAAAAVSAVMETARKEQPSSPENIKENTSQNMAPPAPPPPAHDSAINPVLATIKARARQIAELDIILKHRLGRRSSKKMIAPYRLHLHHLGVPNNLMISHEQLYHEAGALAATREMGIEARTIVSKGNKIFCNNLKPLIIQKTFIIKL